MNSSINEPLLSMAPTLAETPAEPPAEPTAVVVKNDGEMLTLNVVAQDGQETKFRLRPHTSLDKVMSAYCQRYAVNLQSVRFLYDGQRIGKDMTPTDLNMADGDTVDVVLQQTGGCGKF